MHVLDGMGLDGRRGHAPALRFAERSFAESSVNVASGAVVSTVLATRSMCL